MCVQGLAPRMPAKFAAVKRQCETVATGASGKVGNGIGKSEQNVSQ